MPSLLLILSRLAALLSLVGGALGVYRWDRLSKGQRWTSGYLWLSGILGLLSWFFRWYGVRNTVLGNLWDLANVAILFPALIHGVEHKLADPFKPIQVLSVIGWLVWFVYLMNMTEFTTGFHFTVCMVLLGVCGAVFHGFVDQPRVAWESPEFILALGAAIGFLSDVIPFSASHGWLALNQAPQRALWAFRNASWCVAYLLMGVSVLRDRVE